MAHITPKLSLICIFFLIIPSLYSIECESTHLDFLSDYSLGKQDQLNRTFTKMSEKISSLQNVTYENDNHNYKISNVKPHFFYIDSKQSAVISGQYIIISGGRLRVTMNFDWVKTGDQSSNGAGIATAESNDIFFSKFYKVEGGYLLEQLFAYQPVIFSNRKTNITRIQPATITDNDFNILEQMFNPLPKVKSVTQELSDEIEKLFNYYLNQSLYDERRNINEHFQYNWVNQRGSGKNLDITYSFNMTDSDIQQGGVTTFHIMNIPGYDQWKCTLPSPKIPLNPKVYGGVQQFISLDVYSNTIKYAIEHEALDTDLNKKMWQSRFFQFYAGDLYEVIPKLTQRFFASEQVKGNCKASTEGFNLTKGTHTHLNVTIQYNCQLFVGNEKISIFRIVLLSMVEGKPQTKKINYHVEDFIYNVYWEDYMEYKIENKALANHMVQHSLNRLKQSKVFGSGWPLYTRDYPHFIVEDNYTVIYDSTHVDPDMPISDNTLLYIEKLNKKILNE